MAAITVFQRYEKKFLMDVEVMDQILPEIKKHMVPDKHCKDGQTYAISNLYFDTENDDVIRESLQKPFYKEKLRMRSYGIPQNEESPVFLELKKKINKIVTKRRANLTLKEAQDFLYKGYYPQTKDYMTIQVLREIEYYLSHKNVYASTRISYDRYAFFDQEDDTFRLTFDKNLRYLKKGQPGEKERYPTAITGGVDYQDEEIGKNIIPDNLRLMEVKVSNAYPLWFAKLLSTEGIYPVSFSKYGVSYKLELIRQLEEAPAHADFLAHI